MIAYFWRVFQHNTLLRQLMSNASAWTSPSSATTDQSVTTQYQGRTFQVHRMNFIYHITQQDRMSGYMGALVDSGTNGGMAGSDT